MGNCSVTALWLRDRWHLFRDGSPTLRFHEELCNTPYLTSQTLFQKSTLLHLQNQKKRQRRTFVA